MKTSFVLLAFLSHLFAAAYPFLSETVVKRFGPVVGSFLLYLMGCGILLCAALFSKTMRDGCVSVLKLVWGGNASTTVRLVILLYTFSALLFYQGLAINNGHTAEYGFFTRLDSLVMFTLALSLEKERASRINVIGALIAFLAAIVVNRTGLLPLGSLLFAAGFIVLSGFAGSLSKRVIGSESLDPFGLLVIRTFVVTVVLGGFSIMVDSHPSATSAITRDVAWVSVAVGAIFLQGLFWSRFVCFRKMSLWQYAGLSASQAFFTWAISFSLGKSVPPGVFLGFLILPIGEAMCLYSRSTQSK